MTPASTPFTIYKGARFEHTLTFLQSGTSDPVDLTGLTPLVATFSHPTMDRILVELEVTVETPANGVAVVLATADQTSQLKEGFVRFGLRDNLNNPYIASVCPVKFFSPNPA